MKPLGVWHAYTDKPLPSWASFAAIRDSSDFVAAAQKSRDTGVKWVVLLYGCPIEQPVGPHAVHVAERLQSSGLLPHVAAVCYWEECYGALKGGRVQLPTGWDLTRDLPTIIPLYRDYLSRQHAEVKKALPGIPLCWVTDYINNDYSFGPWYYQPLPQHIDLVALEGYLPASGSWAADVEPFMQHTLAQTDKPIVFVPQGFTAPNDPMWQRGPTDESIAAIARWMQHPRVIAGWLFDWASPPSEHGVTGLQDLPCRDTLLRALGV